MAEQGTLNAKVQGSTPWQPTSQNISPRRFLMPPDYSKAAANIFQMQLIICKITVKLDVRAFLNSLPPLHFCHQNSII